MPRRESYQQGEPCWTDYAAADQEGAGAFYGELFGWTFGRPDERGYRLVHLRGEVVGGFGLAPEGLPPSWNTYLAVKDADALAERVPALGGRVVFGPLPAGDDGRFLFAVDPAGASVGLWEGHWAEGIVLVDEPGATCGHELWTAEPPEEFYRALLGLPYGVRRPGEVPGWVTFFMVEDVAATSRATVRAGGRIAGPYGPAAVLRDPWGAMFVVTPAFREGGTR